MCTAMTNVVHIYLHVNNHDNVRTMSTPRLCAETKANRFPEFVLCTVRDQAKNQGQFLGAKRKILGQLTNKRKLRSIEN